MKYLNKETRAAEYYRNAYLQSDILHIKDAYKTHCSSTKLDAWDYCQHIMSKYDGHDMKVLSANSFAFSVGFLFNPSLRTNNPELANIPEGLCVITHNNIIVTEMSEKESK